jgi:hypothetical protein
MLVSILTYWNILVTAVHKVQIFGTEYHADSCRNLPMATVQIVENIWQLCVKILYEYKGISARMTGVQLLHIYVDRRALGYIRIFNWQLYIYMYGDIIRTAVQLYGSMWLTTVHTIRLPT